MGRGIGMSEHALDFEVGEFLVADIAQEQSPAPVANEDEGTLGNTQLAHDL
jgi:hypothetical protein